MRTARGRSTLAILIGMGTPTHWDLADPVPRRVKDLRTLPEKLAEDTVAYTIVPSPPELPSVRVPLSSRPRFPHNRCAKRSSMLPAATRQRLSGVALDCLATASPGRAPVSITPPVQAARPRRRGSAGDSRRAACRPLPRQSGAERVGKLAFPCLLNADCPNEGWTSAPLGPLCFH